MKRFIVWCVGGMILCACLAAAQEPIKAGFIYHLSGRTAALGAIAVQGAKVALDEINSSGGIQGRKVVGFFQDSKGDPNIAAQAFKKLVVDKGVDTVIGVQADEVAVELSKLAAEYGIPLLITGAQALDITGKNCNRFTFRLCPSSVQSAKTGALLAAWTDAKTWAIVASNQTASHELWTFFKRFLRKMRPDSAFEDEKNVFVNHPRTDWAASVKMISESDAEGVLVSLYGGDFIDFVKQGLKTGLFDGKKEFVVVMGSLAELLGLGRDMPTGIWWSSPYWFQASRSPLNISFAQKYEDTYGVPPSWQAQFAYGAVKAYSEAAKRAGVDDKESIATAMQGLSLELPVGKVYIRAKDHQAIMHAMAGKTARMGVTARKRSFRGLGSMILFRPKEIAEPELETECSIR